MAETNNKIDVPDALQYKYKADYTSDWDIHRNYIQTFDAYEAMLMGTVYDSVSNGIDNSRITDSYSTTLAKERADRVIAKLPEGQTIPMGKADVGKAAFMDILRQKWIFPNANAQHSFMEKLNLWQFYSSVYGYMPMFYDWNIALNGYSGPDCWLWNPRNLIPQQGRSSLNDMEYVTALTWVSKTYLQDILDDIENGDEEKPESTDSEGFDEERDDDDPAQPDNDADNSGWDIDALKLLIQVADDASNPDPSKDSKVVRDRTPQSQKRGVCLATRYEAGSDGQWITFAPDHGFIEVRRLDNPHENSRIPFVIKYSQPLFDSFYGLGDFQRSKSLQFARDGLTNFYFKGIKMNLIPPLVVNANGVVKHTLDYREGSVMMETIPNSIRRLETSTAGLATYQAAQDALTGSLLSLYGSQNASLSAGSAMNPSQGKTPQAINLYSDKEATRDGAERRHLEDAIQSLTDGFFSLIANIGTEEIPVALFADDVQDIITSGFGDIKEIFKSFKMNDDGSAGVIKIDPKKLKNLDLRFKVTADSTAKVNKDVIKAAIEEFLGTLGKFQNIFTEDPGVTIHWDAIMKSYEIASGIPNASQFMSFDAQVSQQAKQAAMQQQQEQQTTVKMPNGQVHQSADLGRLYLNTDDWWVKNQILVAMGFQPAPQEVQDQIHESSPDHRDSSGLGPSEVPQPPTTISSGHTFQDPNVASAAEAIMNHPSHSVTPADMKAHLKDSQPTIAASGHAFNDATIAQAASAIHGIQAPKPMVAGPMAPQEPAATPTQ